MDMPNATSEARSKEREVVRELPKMEPKYEIYVRLPFNRGDFVDPPPVDWDDHKSDALWNIISDVERTERKIDWNELAISFGVGVDFLLMMAQTLAERHTNQLMGLFRKAAAGTGTSGAPSPGNTGFPAGISLPDTPASTGDSMRRTASGSGNRPSSPTSVRRESRTDNSTPTSGTPLKSSLAILRPPVTSRSGTPSTNTTVLNQNLTAAVSQNLLPPTKQRPKSPLLPRRRPSTLPVSSISRPPQEPTSPQPSSPAKSTSSSSSSSSSSSPVESRIIKRPPRPTPKPGANSLFPDDDDDEAEPAFLPYKAPPPATSAGSSDLGATLRGAPSRRAPSRAAATAFLSSPSASSGLSERQDMRRSQTSDSSAGETAAGMAGKGGGRRPGPLSPRRAAELAGRGKGKGKGKEGSDGTPSMGSSFSDLDDASVTQSALEEALASNMQDGAATVGSRMSTFGNAFKSRYLPKGNR